jgi:putative inorganic carbon (HCO3(-)) transporter
MELVATRAAYWLTFAAAMAPLVSIAATNILFVAAVLAVLAAYRRLEMPPKLWIALVLFIAGTLFAVAMSGEFRIGFPKVKQLIVLATLPLLFTVFRRDRGLIHRLIAGWAVLATASALWSFMQFLMKRQFAVDHRIDFYDYYVGQRVTGFMSHWMTFGAEQMIAVLMLAAALAFGTFRARRVLWWASAAIISVSIALSFARSVWLGTAVAAVYLVAAAKPKLLLLLPAAAAIAWFAAPHAVRQRVISVYKPDSAVDSNEHRSITRRTGTEMIRAHPWVGLGPDVVKRDFDKYVPADIPRPLPVGAYGHLHNVYLQYAAERGVPTLIAFLWFIGAAAVHLVRSAFRMPATDALGRAVTHGAFAVTIAALAEGFFEVNLGDSEVLRMFLTVVACGYAITHPKAADV